MQTKTVIGIVVALVIVLLAPRAIPQKSSVKQEIRELEQKVNAAYAANDLPKFFAYYAPDFTQYLPTGRTDLPTYERDWTQYISNGNRILADEISDLHIQIGPSADAAIASYLLHVKTHLANGQVTDEDFQETDVVFKRGGSWKIVHLHYSPAPKKAQ